LEKWQIIVRSAASDLRITDNTPTGNLVSYLRVDCPFSLDNYIYILPAAEALRADVLRGGESHPLLSYGLFGGDLRRFEAAVDHTTDEVLQMARRRRKSCKWLVPSTKG
jgi:hypothetical protein